MDGLYLTVSSNVATGLKFDQFKEMLEVYKEDFHRVHGRELRTISELEEYLNQKKTRSIGRRNLTSLKGFTF